MKMFVFEGVLTDWTSGMAVIAAKSLEHAQQLAFAEFGLDYKNETLADFLKREDGFMEATWYPLGKGVEAGVLHHVYGGG